jgi:hypothetical protein
VLSTLNVSVVIIECVYLRAVTQLAYNKFSLVTQYIS